MIKLCYHSDGLIILFNDYRVCDESGNILNENIKNIFVIDNILYCVNLDNTVSILYNGKFTHIDLRWEDEFQPIKSARN